MTNAESATILYYFTLNVCCCLLAAITQEWYIPYWPDGIQYYSRTMGRSNLIQYRRRSPRMGPDTLRPNRKVRTCPRAHKHIRVIFLLLSLSAINSFTLQFSLLSSLCSRFKVSRAHFCTELFLLQQCAIYLTCVFCGNTFFAWFLKTSYFLLINAWKATCSLLRFWTIFLIFP